jgi:hypothetical protein
MAYTTIVAFFCVLLAASCVQAQSAKLDSAERSISLSLHADVPLALRAFGPAEERLWSPGWEPKFIFLQGGAADPDFAVFTITHGTSESFWTLSNHDRQRGTLQYVVFKPGEMLTVIDVRCVAAGEHLTRATVTYRKTALSPEANAQISHFSAHFTEEGNHWEQTIDRYLQRKQTKKLER